MELREAIGKYKTLFALTEKQVEFIEEMCYINKGMWDGNVNELITREAKRDLALTLRSFRELRDEELEQLLEENGDSEWMKRTISKLDK